MAHSSDANADGDARDADGRVPANPDAGAEPVHFVDVTLQAGIDHVQALDFSCGSPAATGECGEEAPRMTGGAAAGDADGDGHVDLYVTRYDGPDLLYRNLGDGTFENVAEAAGLTMSLPSNGAGFCDIDNDGDLDLYVTALGDVRHYLFINDGTGHFTEDAAARGAVLLPADLHMGTSVSFGDFDVDGWPDVYVGEWRMAYLYPTPPPGYARLLRNRGAAEPGHFDDVTESAGVALDSDVLAFAASFSDLDDDGYPDLAIAADFGASRLFWNDGDGTFTDGTAAARVGTDENGMGSAIGDYDGDGRLDWFVTSIYDPDATCSTARCGWDNSGNRLYRKAGGRFFEDHTDLAGVRDGAWGWGATFFDYDNDGDLDLVMTNGIQFDSSQLDAPFNANPMRLWRNDGGVYTEVALLSGLTDTDNGKGLLVLDFDEDGDLDIFVVNNGAAPRLYRNDGGNTKNWLRIRLRGSESTRDAFGTKAWLRRTSGAPAAVREHRGGSNFLGQNESVIHFGLGDLDAPVSELVVRWPSGRQQTFTDVAINQTLDLVEPTGDP